MMSQCVLEHKGKHRITCWLESSDKLKVGNSLTLKDHEQPDWWWNVIAVGEPMPKALVKDSHNAEKWHENDYRRKLKGSLI